MPLPVDLDDLARREGFRVEEVVRTSYDHNVYLIRHEGERRVLKVVVDATKVENLRREGVYSGLLGTVADAMPGVAFRTPRLRRLDEGWLVRDMLDGPPVVDPDTASEDDYHAGVRRIAQVLADLDMLAPSAHAARPQYRDEHSMPGIGEAQRMREVAGWLDDAHDHGLVGEQERRVVLERLETTLGDVQPGFEMFDVKVEDFLDLPDGKLGVFDLEYAHLFGRRYYDVVTLYVTLSWGLGLPRVAASLLNAFLAAQPRREADITRPLLALFLTQAVAQLHDSVRRTDRAERARELFDAAYRGDLDALRG